MFRMDKVWSLFPVRDKSRAMFPVRTKFGPCFQIKTKFGPCFQFRTKFGPCFQFRIKVGPCFQFMTEKVYGLFTIQDKGRPMFSVHDRDSLCSIYNSGHGESVCQFQDHINKSSYGQLLWPVSEMFSTSVSITIFSSNVSCPIVSTNVFNLNIVSISGLIIILSTSKMC